MNEWLEKFFGPDWRDRAERLFWTAVSVVLGVLATELAGVDLWWAALATPVINAITLFVRTKLSALPSPGEGLPGLPTSDAGTPVPTT